MRKYLAVLVLLCLSCLCCRPPVVPENMAERAESKSVALVRYVDEEDNEVSDLIPAAEMKPYCTGVWVGQNMILTAAHCVRHLAPKADGATPVGQLTRYSVKGEEVMRISHMATVYRWDEKKDLALVQTGVPPLHEIAYLTPDDERDGEPVDIVGQTMGLWFSYCHGYIASTRAADPTENNPKTYQISAPVWFGNSGGGAFDSRGDLAGIASFIRRSGPELSFFVHSDEIREFLNAVGA